jgi:DNA ligase-1
MRHFAALVEALDQTTKTTKRLQALVRYFEAVPHEDAVWCIALLTHRRPRRVVNTRLLRAWAAEFANVPLWLFEETYHIVGDLAETMALVVEANQEHADFEVGKVFALNGRMGELIALKDRTEEEKKAYIFEAWQSMPANQRFVFNKLITGGFRMGVSARNLTHALAKFTGRETNTIAHRLMGNWDPATVTFEELVLAEDATADASKPYPFFLAYPVEGQLAELGDPSSYLVEDKWDGIRGQIVRRANEIFIWSRGEELVTDQYPELQTLVKSIPPGCVLDGEIVVHNGAQVLAFNLLQTRIARKTVSKKLMQEAPVKFIAYDILEWKGEDIRERPQSERRAILEAVVAEHPNEVLLLSKQWQAHAWEELINIRAAARERNSEGLMLKANDATYGVGRKRGAWYKWKLDPHTVDAVLIYAMRGHGRRANLYTDYTFAVWDGDELVPFTKAYSGLTDAEFVQVDRFVKQNTLEKFGPVRSVIPSMVFEIAFEGITRSKRHKSGIALRFPRMVRIRFDKPAREAATLAELEQLLGD